MRAPAPTAWFLTAFVIMTAVAAFDAAAGTTIQVPVAVSVGPLLAAIACRPAAVAALGVLAVGAAAALGVPNDNFGTGEWAIRTLAVAGLSAAGVAASSVRATRERELFIVRPARVLEPFARRLLSADSGEEILDAFTATAAPVLAIRSCALRVGPESGAPWAEDHPDEVVPLDASGRRIGEIALWYAEGPDEQRSTLLPHALEQLAVALDRVSRLDRQEQLNRQLQALREATAMLAGAHRRAEIAAAAVVDGRKALSADAALFLERDDDSAVVMAADGMVDGDAAPGDRLHLRRPGPVDDALRLGRVLTVSDPRGIETALPGVGRPRPGGVVVIPVGRPPQATAALCLLFARPRYLETDEAALLASLVGSLSAAFERALRFEAEEAERERATQRAARSDRLERLTAALAGSDHPAGVAQRFLDVGLDAVGATWGAAYELAVELGALRLLAARESAAGAAPEVVPLDGATALAEAAAGSAVLLTDPDAVAERYPALALRPGQAAVAAVPLVAYGAVVGVIGLVWADAHPFPEEERSFLELVGRRTGEALERARLRRTERRDEQRWALLAGASAVLSEALEPTEVLRRLVRWAVPATADACAVLLAAGDGNADVIAYVDLPDGEALADGLDARQLHLEGVPDLDDLFRRGEPRRVTHGAAAMLEGLSDDPFVLDIGLRVEIRELLLAPLVARGNRVGLLVLAAGHSGREFDDGDVRFVGDLAARVAVAYDNALLYTAEQQLTVRLQSALLPASIVAPPGLRTAVRYRATGARAGGDWYDVMALGPTTAGLAVGDVVGHGIEAAAAMSRLCNALRAYARVSAEPGAVLGQLARFALDDEAGSMATALYGVVDLAASEFTYVSAGHPPPIVVTGGAARLLPAPQRPTLGADLGLGPFAGNAASVPLPAGALLVLYTDGLVERRGETIDEGIERLRRIAEARLTPDLETLADAILAEAAPPEPFDDIALLIAATEA